MERSGRILMKLNNILLILSVVFSLVAFQSALGSVYKVNLDKPQNSNCGKLQNGKTFPMYVINDVDFDINTCIGATHIKHKLNPGDELIVYSDKERDSISLEIRDTTEKSIFQDSVPNHAVLKVSELLKG